MLVLGIKDRIVNSNCSTAALRVSVYTWVGVFYSVAKSFFLFSLLLFFSQLYILTVFLTLNGVWDRVMCF